MKVLFNQYYLISTRQDAASLAFVNGALQEIVSMRQRQYLYVTCHRFVFNGRLYDKSAHMSCLGAGVIGVLKRRVAIFSHSYPMTSYCRKYKDIISFSSSLLTKLKHPNSGQVCEKTILV